MKLISLRLTNFRAHAKFEFTFVPGVVGIIGRNGSGKSSLLEGLYYAITGAGDTQANQIRWGAKSGGTELTFEIDGTQYILTRKLGRSAATLEYGDEKIIGTRAVNDKISEFLGTSLDNLKELLFVAQEALDAPLKGTEAARKEAFGKLFGCHVFERLRTVLHSQITLLSTTSTEQELITKQATLQTMRGRLVSDLELIKKELSEIEGQAAQQSREQLVKILSATPESEVLKELEALEEYQAGLAEELKKFKETNWDRPALNNHKEYLNAVISLLRTGTCPVCRLQGGDCGYTHEEAEKEQQAIDAQLAAAENFDMIVSEQIKVGEAIDALARKNTVPDEQHKSAKEYLTRANDIDARLREAYASKGAIEANIVNTDKLLADVATELERCKVTSRIVDTLNVVRDCFHRDSLQQDLRAYGVSMLNSKLDEMISVFTIPYTVFFNEEGLMKFTAPGDAQQRDFTDLSGGQRKIVALAYRLALMRLFTGNLGLAVLDEPTPYIDKGNIQSMAEALQSLNRLSMQQGMTVLVATHEEALFPAFGHMVVMGEE